MPLFRTMALNTALALFALSAGSLLADPESGWVSVIASREDGGGATRRQLAFLLLPAPRWMGAAAGYERADPGAGHGHGAPGDGDRHPPSHPDPARRTPAQHA